LRIHDVLEEHIAAYDARSMHAVDVLQPPERQDQPVPRHPGAGKDQGPGRPTGRLTLCALPAST